MKLKCEYSHSCVGLCGSVSTVYSTVGQECHFSEKHLLNRPLAQLSSRPYLKQHIHK